MEGRSLRDAADAADAERFTGRAAELAVMRELLDAATPSRIVYVHGPGGIGKSALLRATARLASAAGFRVDSVDARRLPGDLGLLLERLLATGGGARCILLDEADALGATLAPLRDALLDALSDDCRIVFAGRRTPDPSWRELGLPAIVRDLALGPLADADAAQILAASGVDAGRRGSIVSWAKGSPLALTVAAAVPVGTAARTGADLEERLIVWLAGRTMLDVDPAVLEVAALVRAVDARLIAAALPGRPTRDAMRRLAGLPVIQRLGPRLALHPVLAAAIRDRLRTNANARYRELIRRIALHLGGRARLGDIEALVEMSEFIEDPELARAVSNVPSATHYADTARPGELGDFARAGGFDREPDWPELADWHASGPAIEYVLRRSDGTALLYCIVSRVDELPGIGSVTRSLAAAAQQSGLDPARAFAGVALYADEPLPDRAEASRLSSGAFVLRAGTPDIDAILIHFPEPDRNPQPAHVLGFGIRDTLPRAVDVSDFRPGGVVGFIEGIVLREQGFEPTPAAGGVLLASGRDPERDARLREALDRVFGTDEDDRRLRRVIELAHLGPRRSEQECLEALHVSRPTWYRLLRRARERVLAGG